MTGSWLTVLGMDDDGFESLSSAARTILETAEIVIGGDRQFARLPDYALAQSCERLSWPSPMADLVDDLSQYRGRRTVVLATGDPMWFGIGATLSRQLPQEEMTIVPARSAFSLAAARMVWSLDEVACISVHGRPLESLALRLCPGARLLILARDGESAAEVAEFLTERGFGDSRITALAHMGGPEEARFEGSAADFALSVPDFHTLAVELSRSSGGKWQPRLAGLADASFQHDGKMTKREARAIALAKLKPHPGAQLWDIGCGSGSVAIEWLRSEPHTSAIGLEPREDRRAMAAHNAARLGVPNLHLLDAVAPEGLEELDPPDAIFIGGGLSRETVNSAMDALKTGGRLVAHAVTLESEEILLSLHAAYQGELIRIAIARAEPVGPYRGWKQAMPVTQWAWEKP